MIEAPTSKKTATFYDKLMTGDKARGMLGKDTRFNALKVSHDPSTRKYFHDVVKHYLSPDMKVLDVGCGPGSFVITIASLCREVIGVDISQNFVSMCNENIKQLSITNAKSAYIQPGKLPYANEEFDVILMVDVIHHFGKIKPNLHEAMRVLKPNGQVLIFEPNKLNPLIYLVHLLDRNEWGLLKLGRPGIYRKVLADFIEITEIDFNGIVIGPQSKIYRQLSDLLNNPKTKPFLGWLNPKIFIHGRKNNTSDSVTGQTPMW